MKAYPTIPDDIRQPKPLFVVINRFELDSFPVRIRRPRLGKTRASKNPSSDFAQPSGDSAKDFHSTKNV